MTNAVVPPPTINKNIKSGIIDFDKNLETFWNLGDFNFVLSIVLIRKYMAIRRITTNHTNPKTKPEIYIKTNVCLLPNIIPIITMLIKTRNNTINTFSFSESLRKNTYYTQTNLKLP
ncbi:hypothetical protein [Helicobacter sp. T3_23-1059]